MANTVTFNARGRLAKMRELMQSNAALQREIITQWIKIFGAFIRLRFVRLSRGGGEWPALSPLTIARRRRRSDVILRDTGLLFAQLAPNIERQKSFSRTTSGFEAVVNFGGSGKYKDSAGLTTQQVMSFHQTGGPRLPQRKILVPPDRKTRQQMIKAAKRIILQYVS